MGKKGSGSDGGGKGAGRGGFGRGLGRSGDVGRMFSQKDTGMIGNSGHYATLDVVKNMSRENTMSREKKK